MFWACKKKDEETPNQNEIVYKSINKEYVLIRNVDSLQNSNDEISNHIDSILSGLIEAEMVSTGQKTIDLSNGGNPDIGFEIINLNLFNPNGLPESFDSLATRAFPLTVQILDNSTWGYCDALTEGTEISSSGNWTQNTCVLGTFMNAGQFQGNGNRFLAYRFLNPDEYSYGWIKLYCSQHSDTLRIIEYGFNNNPGSRILSGQKE